MEELRSRHKSIQSAAHHIALECIHPQSAHSSPYHVHPYPSPVRLQHAFETHPQGNASPRMFHPKGLKPHLEGRGYSTPADSPILGRALCLTPRGSPLPGRVSHLSDRFHDSLSLTADTESLVAKISAMFPTVSETHIKILLKKYYNREAVVISALQVEKHPITTPGPVSMSPCAARLLGKASVHGSGHLTDITASPHGSPSLFRPASGASSYYYGTPRSVDGQPARHQSPKMKLKYLKSIFPKAEETLILDVLANKDNNVQKASEELISMGFPKKDTVVAYPPRKKEEAPPPKKVVTIMKTLEEKNQLKQKLQSKYKSVAERVVAIALESVAYNEERAEQILAAVLQEELAPKVVSKPELKPAKPPQPDTTRPILKTSSSVDPKYKSQYSMTTKGPNPSLCKGPKDSLLLEDYMAWTGPNPGLKQGSAVKAEGPEPRSRASPRALGPTALAKGPAGLAKGSIYQKLTKKSAKIGSVH
ncbi:hypothetical protein JYU34_000147 [Plutella xylostella]|uniref:CUE domain-containing protein n=1 Tax=Plutella xylostella TaxID=51655 RepID=A0ABQ7R735_PLUXY|nr:hypothetical protein JYU34_000147 [Plutella xylostella]